MGPTETDPITNQVCSSVEIVQGEWGAATKYLMSRDAEGVAGCNNGSNQDRPDNESSLLVCGGCAGGVGRRRDGNEVLDPQGQRARRGRGCKTNGWKA